MLLKKRTRIDSPAPVRLIELEVGIGHLFEGIRLQHVHASTLGHLPESLVGLEDARERCGERGRVARRNQDPSFTVGDGRRNAADGGRDDGKSSGPSFQ